MDALGRLFDVSAGVMPIDFQTARTGKRVSLKNAAHCTIVVVKGAGTDGDDQTFTLNEHNAASGGTSQVLAKIDYYYEKEETTLDGDEAWVKVTQTIASTVAPGDPSAQVEAFYVFEIDAEDLSPGFNHISMDNDGAGSNAQLATIIYILSGLAYPNVPASLPVPL